MLSTFIKKLETPKKIVIIPHKNPDGDALGSCLALHFFLLKTGHSADVISPNEYPEFLNWMPGQENVINYSTANEKTVELIEKAEIIFTLDYNQLNRIGNLEPIVASSKAQKIMIDHHENPGDYADVTYSDASIGSTCEMVFELLHALNPIEIDKSIATCLYTGIMTDTGSFRHSNTNQKSHKIAMDCLAFDINNSKIYQSIYENKSKAQISLLAKVIDNLRFDLEGMVASFIITKKMIDDSGIIPGDVDGFTDFVRSINGVEIAIMVCENEAGKHRVNFRSKGKYVINDIAKSFGGGGHKFAAGASAEGKSDIILQNILDKTFSVIDVQNKTSMQ